ncbi:Fe2+-enterobactin ABC transporter substrate-binding protein [Microbacterium sp. NPDC008134]|uniref:Fe2+-enterobactin ABC transporter substrate-binding protein n=1 Tax=Microbacterium sp. NPDC008134 TaxID=3364183 RepID=UPI0036E1F7B4
MRSRLLAVSALAATAALALAGCSSSPSPAADAASDTPTGDGSWPRTIEHGAGETEIPAQPLRIVSVSPSITGSLLAIDAPIAGSAATTVTPLTDDKGFFTQWADAADDAGVEVVYTDLELDLDAVDLFEPDLIIGSVNGGDATLDAYDQLSEIAPTVLLDYGTITWQELTTELGEITGLEDAASATIAEYDEWVATQAEKVELPEQPVTAAVYMGADGVWAFASDSPQAQLLTSLGFTYAGVDEEYRTEQAGANGVDILSAENAASGLGTAETLFLVAMGGGDPVSALSSDPLLANQPAVAADRVHSLGSESFRLDYYSAKNTAQLIVDTFSG